MAKDKQIAKLLRADISMSSDLAEIAKMLQSKGRGGDSILAHITKREAQMLKDAGGSGTVNPETGLMEFFDGEGDWGGYVPPETQQEFGGLYPGGQFPQAEAAPEQTTYYPSGEVYAGGPVSNIVPTDVGAPPPVTPVMATGAGTLPAPVAPGVVSPAAQAVPAGMTPEAERVVREYTTPTEKPSWYDKLTTEQMVRLGLAGAGAVYGGVQARKGEEEARKLKEEQQAMAAPYQAQGREMVRAAQAGELTPTGQQSMQALRARLAQGVSARGGVGAQQAAAQAEAYRQQLLQQQYDYGLKVTSIGDQLALGAIKTGMQADQALRQASTNFYTQLASIAGGIPLSAERTGAAPRA